MPSDAWSPDSTSHKSLESLKESFKQRLNAILYKQLTVENIETFADEALSETVILTDDVLAEYRNNPEFNVSVMPLNIQAQENEAFAVLGLENINEILQRINNVKDKIESLKTYIHAGAKKVGTVITPPQPEYPTKIMEGIGGFEKRLFPRLLTLLYILEHDFEIPPASVQIIEGAITPNMVRKTPYVRVEIPDLKRAVYICDEEGNVSYIFDTEKLAKQGLTLSEIDVDDKGDKNSLIAYHPGIGIRVIQSVYWRDRIMTALEEQIPEIQTGVMQKHAKEEREEVFKPDIQKVARGELDPWRGFWTDENEMHWGNKATIARKLGKTFMIFKNRMNDSKLKTLNIIGLQNKTRNTYCFEEFIKLFPELTIEKRVATTGEWAGYWTDPKTGKHWGTAGRLQEKLNVADWITIKRYVKKGNLQNISVQDLAGRNAESYCYEDFLEMDEFVNFMTAPQVIKDGEWAGFLIDDANQHWASVATIASLFKTTNATINLYAEKMKLHGKNLKTRNQITTGFCLEDFQINEEFMNFINSPKVDTEGHWMGFWSDENNGSHWGTILQISNKLSISRDRITRLINENQEKFPPLLIKDMGGKQFKGFCLEEIEKYYNKTK